MPLREYNDQTRMTRAQLAERIRQMEATAARNSQIGAPNDRHRPMEDRRRREKIARYTEELRRRELADDLEAAIERGRQEKEAQAAAAAEPAQAAADARDPFADIHANLPPGATTERYDPAAAAAARAATIERAHAAALAENAARDERDRRAAEDAALMAQSADADRRDGRLNSTRRAVTDAILAARLNHQEHNAMQRHDEWNPGDDHTIAEQAEAERTRRADAAARAEPHLKDGDPAMHAKVAELLRERDHSGPPTVAIQQPATPVTMPPPRRIPCPQCNAGAGEACRNYKGQAQGTYHTARRLALQRADHIADLKAAQHRVAEATTARRATVQAIRDQTTPDAQERGSDLAGKAPGQVSAADERPQPTPAQQQPPEIHATTPAKRPTPATDNGLPVGRGGVPRPAPTPAKDDGLTDLDRTVEALVRQHTSGAVIDAAWEAARRIFQPVNGGAR